jgi:choline dehydrogenase-like flavoprotein
VSPTSTDPFKLPSLNPNLMASESDMFIMREAIRSIRRFLDTAAFADYVIAPLNHATTDGELDNFIRGTTNSLSHGVGTAAMSAYGAHYGVVDPDLRVKKVDGLRVVDASVLVRPPMCLPHQNCCSSHIYSPSYPPLTLKLPPMQLRKELLI